MRIYVFIATPPCYCNRAVYPQGDDSKKGIRKAGICAYLINAIPASWFIDATIDQTPGETVNMLTR